LSSCNKSHQFKSLMLIN